MNEWLEWLTGVLQDVQALWSHLMGLWVAVRAWYYTVISADIPAILLAWLSHTTLRERLLGAAVASGLVVLAVCISWYTNRTYRIPHLARQHLLREIDLLVTQLRGRAYRPARITQRGLQHRLKRSRRALEPQLWDRLWAQWKQADREVQTLLTAARRQPGQVVRTAQLTHISTLRATIHSEVQRGR